jgi:hypothetical protein
MVERQTPTKGEMVGRLRYNKVGCATRLGIREINNKGLWGHKPWGKHQPQELRVDCDSIKSGESPALELVYEIRD